MYSSRHGKKEKRDHSTKEKKLIKLINKPDSEDADSEHELSYYINDRVKLMKEVLKIIKPRKIKSMAPNSVKNLKIEELNSMLLEELLGISNKRLKYIFNGQNLEEDSSSSTDPETEQKPIDIISLDDISDDDFVIDLDSDVEESTKKKRCKKHSQIKIKQEPKRKKVKKEKEDNSGRKKKSKDGTEDETGEQNLMSVLELLELQARARAIRSQLVLENAKKAKEKEENETSKDVSLRDSDNDEIIIESPRNVEIVITSSESENESSEKKNNLKIENGCFKRTTNKGKNKKDYSNKEINENSKEHVITATNDLQSRNKPTQNQATNEEKTAKEKENTDSTVIGENNRLKSIQGKEEISNIKDNSDINNTEIVSSTLEANNATENRKTGNNSIISNKNMVREDISPINNNCENVAVCDHIRNIAKNSDTTDKGESEKTFENNKIGHVNVKLRKNDADKNKTSVASSNIKSSKEAVLNKEKDKNTTESDTYKNENNVSDKDENINTTENDACKQGELPVKNKTENTKTPSNNFQHSSSFENEKPTDNNEPNIECTKQQNSFYLENTIPAIKNENIESPRTINKINIISITEINDQIIGERCKKSPENPENVQIENDSVKIPTFNQIDKSLDSESDHKPLNRSSRTHKKTKKSKTKKNKATSDSEGDLHEKAETSKIKRKCCKHKKDKDKRPEQKNGSQTLSESVNRSENPKLIKKGKEEKNYHKRVSMDDGDGIVINVDEADMNCLISD